MWVTIKVGMGPGTTVVKHITESLYIKGLNHATVTVGYKMAKTHLWANQNDKCDCLTKVGCVPVA
jgi:hypothetical protein